MFQPLKEAHAIGSGPMSQLREYDGNRRQGNGDRVRVFGRTPGAPVKDVLGQGLGVAAVPTPTAAPAQSDHKEDAAKHGAWPPEEERDRAVG